MIISAGGLFAFILLFAIDTFAHNGNPYMGLLAYVIAPGFILTDLTEKLWSDPEMKEWGLKNTPQRRLGKPEDLVGAAVFLASLAAAFLTGQIIYVDGGFTAAWHWPIA